MNLDAIIHNVILGLWVLAIVTGFVCFASLLWKRLAGKYFLLAVWLAVDGAISLWLLRVYFTAGFKAYAACWQQWLPVELVLTAGIILEAYILQARHCRRFLWPGAIMACIFGITSLALAFCTTGLVSDSLPATVPVMASLTRYFAIVCFLFIRFSAWFFGLFFIKVRENVHWHVRILSGYFFCQSLAWAIFTFLPSLLPTGWTRAGHILNFGSATVAYCFWCFKLTPQGEQWSEPPEMAHEEFNAQTREHHTANRCSMARVLRLRHALLEAWRLS